MKLTKSQNEAMDLLLKGQNVFLTGEAGTGKSFLLNQFVTKQLTEVVRQKDLDFIANLNKCRYGDKSCLEYFNNLDNEVENVIQICGRNKVILLQENQQEQGDNK